MKTLLFSLALLTPLLLARPGQAGDMVRYRTADGNVGYASPHLVPAGATIESENYQPAGKVTIIENQPQDTELKAAEAKHPPTSRRQTSSAEDDRKRQRWQSKARTARRDLARAQREYEQWKTRCRGVKERHSLYELPPGCTTYEKAKLDAARQDVEDARSWLEDGLFETCRRASDCLPGYIR